MTNQLSVELVDSMGNDLSVARAAWVSTNSDAREVTDKRVEGLIRYLATSRPMHSSPFEHVTATFLVKAPLFVRDQWVRHRTLSYNCLSLRYSRVESQSIEEMFYFPPTNRPLINKGSKSRPIFDEPASEDLHYDVCKVMGANFETSYQAYIKMVDNGIAEEVARNVLPSALMTRFYVTGNLLNWWKFVNERTASNAQWEIKQLAYGISDQMNAIAPLAWGYLNADENGSPRRLINPDLEAVDVPLFDWA